MKPSHNFIAQLPKRLKGISLSKRQQFVFITLALCLGLILTEMAVLDLRYPLVIALAIAAYVLTAFGLREDLRGIEFFTLLTLPTLFTAAVALFYFLLPPRWLTRLPIALLYGVGMYALLLTENIYNVATERSIALLRAAHSVGFLITLLTYFLLTSTILAFHLSAFVNAILISALTFVLTFQALYAIELEERVSEKVRNISLAIALVFFDLGWIFSFWPIKQTLITLFLTTSFYGATGMAAQYLVERLYKKTVVEFASVVAIVFCIVLFATSWRGTF